MIKGKDEPRIGVYVCHCGNNISETVDVAAVVDYAKELKGVVVARDYKFMCSDPGQDVIRQDIKDKNLNRIVVSSCSPRMHEQTFRRLCEQAGVNKYEFQMANIREHCSWVTEDRTQATEKAKALVRAAVARVFFHEPLQTKKVKVNPQTLVVGAGIAGIQAALEIADSGNKVYLVEKEPSIGGNMAKLDKTFPTLDCSACILTPKMVSVSQHENIELLSYSEITEVSGYVGNFKVKIKKKARFVNEKCTGCAECEQVCSVSIPNKFDEGLRMRTAIYRPFPQAVPNIFTIDKKENRSPCRIACPAGCNNQGYVALISKGKFQEALELIREKLPIPAVCARICTSPCEDNCNRKEVDEELAIRALKRFVIDLEMKGLLKGQINEQKLPPAKKRKEKVAIIGSGPAGLTTAYDLAKMGYQPTIFEALPIAGGMLRVGIPKFRLPPEIIDYDIEKIKEAGVEILTNTSVGPDLTLKDLFRRGYQTIFIAIGTHKSRRLNIEGEDLEGVIHGVSFLHGIGMSRKIDLEGKTVAIVGGGNVALDSVRSALRLGAKEIFIIYRRSRKEMLAVPDEVEEAEKEGARIYFLMAPAKILGQDGKVTSIECTPMKLGEPDEAGRRYPIPDKKKKKVVLKADVIIPAVGQLPDFSFLSDEIAKFELTEKGISPKFKILPLEGVELEGVYGFTEFLQAVSLGKEVKIGNKVIVIGGGNVALDVARTALRLGGKEVHLVCLEPKEQMPAYKHEIKEAEEEGIVIHPCKGPKKILGKDNRAIGLETVECISVFDQEGKFNPQFKDGGELCIAGDTFIVAVGQVVDYTLLKGADGVLVTEQGYIKADEVTLSTNITGVFAGGDVIGGTGLAVYAIAQGHEAAISIDRYLRGLDLKEGREKKEEIGAELPERRIERQPRQEMPKLPVFERIRNFREIELGYTEEQAKREAERCLSCGGCSACEECAKVCEPEAIDYNMEDEFVEVEVGNIIVATGYELFDASRAKEYGYKKYDNVITGLEFERLSNAAGPTSGKILLQDGKEPKSVAILHCIGSRDENYNKYCSRICCMYSLKFAHLVREKTDAQVYEFYIDMRAFGKGYEEFYERVQKEKVNIIRGKIPEITDVAESPEEEGKLIVKCEDTLLGLNRRIPVDMVILSGAIEPRQDAERIAKLFSLSRGTDGFFIEKHPKLDPMATMSDGILIAGCCQAPKDIPDTVAQGSGAAARALSILTKGEVEIEAITAVIDKDFCSGCRICNNLCPYSAIEFDEKEKVSKVIEEMCKGCGTCVAACPAGAIKACHFTDEQILAEIDGLMAVAKKK